ncbi:MAG: ParA family protein [Desulfobacula sp.]|uniref:ParA family partition ATPase n=1 Tax=Desulfobacula sp. TaxID=2593537 RepID=UPI0039B830F6|nr:ParA family protein [Desulfobacula sp.]
MKVITLANQKGGCGKSTAIINLAIEFASKGDRVLLIDTDPQRSSYDTLQIRKDNLVHTIVAYSNLYEPLGKFEDQYEYIFIDTPPHADEVMAMAIACSDIVIMPVQDSPLDIMSTKSTVELVRKAKELNPGLLHYFLLSRIQPRTVLAKELVDILERNYKMGILKTPLSNRVAYKYSLIYGNSVSELRNAAQAAQEIKTLAQEIKELVKAGGLPDDSTKYR